VRLTSQEGEIGKIYQRPELVEEGDRWIEWARLNRLDDFRRLVLKRLETLRQKVKRTKSVTLELGDEAKEDFDAARRLACQKARQSLSNRLPT
jgi:hypothetical protein